MDAIRAERKHVTVNGLRLSYLDWGGAGRPWLLCLHGFTEQAHIFDEFAEAVSPRHRVLSLDFRGHGESQWAPDGYTRDKYLADVTAFVGALGIDEATIVGLSLGGIVGMLHAAAQPRGVKRLVLADIGPETGDGATRQRAGRPPRPMGFASFDDAFAWSRSGSWFSGPDEQVRKDLANKLRRRDDGKWVWKLDPALFEPPARPDPITTERLWRAFEAIACPIMLVRGKDSAFVDDGILARMRRAQPSLRHADVERAAHIVTVDNPRGFIAATREFLAA
ncbi:MAG: alpha/beta hydrolase [SAR202 cluster bacterium]|nr:alpha/beta hydrolase [SAR202 cluster bacterium]